MKHLFYVFLFICSIFCVFCGTPTKKFKVNLDLPPQERFKDLVIEKKENLKELQIALQSVLNIPSSIYKLVEYYAYYFYWDQEFIEELKGISKYSELPLGEIFFVNFMYEIFASCTSIITQDNEGNILHGRNLDYGFKDQFVNLMTRLEFYENGEFLFEGDGIAGYVGIITGLKKNSFTVSINERFSTNYLDTLYQIIFKKAQAVPFFIRRVLGKAKNFNEAVELFKNEEFGAPCYLIVSGINKNEGVVITRDRSDVYNISQINTDKENQWFIVQTNYDRDVPDPASDYRRIPAENRLKLIGRNNINEKILYDNVLILPPNFRNVTITTAILSAKNNFFDTIIWDN